MAQMNKPPDAPEEPLPYPRRTWVALGIGFVVVAASFHAFHDLDPRIDPVQGFLARFHLAYLGWALAAYYAWRHPPRGRRATLAILAGAAVLRLVAWNTHVLLETDVHRYLWDGWTFSRGFNPYEFAPVEVLRRGGRDEGADPWADDEEIYDDPESLARLQALRATLTPEILVHLRRVNHPTIPTCYPPTAQLGFAFCAWLAPANAWAWKAFVASVDFLICLMVLAFLKDLGRPEAWVLLYAWNPLPLKEYANTGHYDPVATLFALLGTYLVMKRQRVAAGAALGMGVLGKVYPAVLVLAFVRRLRLAGCLAAAGVVVLFWAPFLTIGPGAFDGLLAFAKDWEFNSSLFTLTYQGLLRLELPSYELTLVLQHESGVGAFYQQLKLDAFLWAKFVVGAALLVVLGLLVRWDEEADWSWPARAFGALGALFMLAPVADPWYLPWFLPYAAVLPSMGILLLSGTVGNYYLYFLEWKYLAWARTTEYLPVFVMLGFELRLFARDNPSFLPSLGRSDPDADPEPAGG